MKNVEGVKLRFLNASFYKDSNLAQAFLDSDGTDLELKKLASEEIYDAIMLHGDQVYGKVSKLEIKMPNNTDSLAKKHVPDFNSDTQDATKELFKIWYVNNLVNGYFINELVSGNPEYYKKGVVDIVKRQSGVWGPQIKPRVGDNGSAQTFRAWIVKDSSVKLKSTNSKEPSIESFLQGFYNNMGLTDDQIAERIKNVIGLFESSGYKVTDGAGFMHPDRWEDLSRGFGSSYHLGNVMKPMYFGIHTRYVPHLAFKTEEEAIQALKDKPYLRSDSKGGIKFNPLSLNDNGEYQLYIPVAKPVYLKYASMVLTDSMLGITPINPKGKFPELLAIREAMTNNSVGELIFSSSIKLGAPEGVTGLGEAIN
jgi:hypothetical protein